MIINDKTKYKDFEQAEKYATQDSLQRLLSAAERHFKNCYELTIDEFFGILSGDYSLLGNLNNPTILQVYWLKRFKDFVEEFSKACERLTLQPTPDEQQCKNGCVKVTPQEAMLIFIREYFGLPSFYEAGKRTIGEYLTARKDRYNEARQHRNYEELQKRKLKLKR